MPSHKGVAFLFFVALQNPFITNLTLIQPAGVSTPQDARMLHIG